MKPIELKIDIVHHVNNIIARHVSIHILVEYHVQMQRWSVELSPQEMRVEALPLAKNDKAKHGKSAILKNVLNAMLQYKEMKDVHI